MSLRDRILSSNTDDHSTMSESTEAYRPEFGEELEMTSEQFVETFQAEVAQSFMDKLRGGKYEIEEGYGGSNLQERILGGGSPLAPYQHGANMVKGPKASMARPAGASWQYNPVDVRADMKHRNPAPKKSGIEKKSPTPRGVPVDVRADSARKMPKMRLRSDADQSPTKKGWSGSRMESDNSGSNLLESIDDTISSLFG